MRDPIEIDGQVVDPAATYFRYELYRDIGDMAELAKLALLPHLTGATFCGTRLDDTGLAHVARVHTLENLDLQQTAISDHGLACLAALPRLRHLRLKDNPQVTSACVAHLARLTSLVDLQLHETSIDERGLDPLVQLPALADLCLSVEDDNYTYDGLLALSRRMPACAILVKGRGTFEDGTFHGTWPAR